MQEVQTTLPIGTIIRERYIVEDLLGKGGFGAVYLVRDQRVKGNLFALKEMVDTSKQERARFAFECEVLKRVDHLNLKPGDDNHGPCNKRCLLFTSSNSSYYP